MHENQFGRFIDNGDAYAIHDPGTPMPWVNVVSNGRYGFVVSQNGGGFSWVDHCQFNVITRWEMDLARDERGRFLYVSEPDENGDGPVWSLSPQPCRTRYDRYRCVHRPGMTTFETEAHGIGASWTMTVAREAPCELWLVRLANQTGRTRKLRVASFFEWCCGVAPDVKREFHRLFFTTQADRSRAALFATKNMWEAPFKVEEHWNRPWPYVAALGVRGIDSDHLMTIGDKSRFLGRYGDQARPLAMTTADVNNGGFGRSGDPVSALGGDIEIPPNGSCTLAYVMALGSDDAQTKGLLDLFGSVSAIEEAVEDSAGAWGERLDCARVETELDDFNLLNNTWLPYQAISGRLWGRTGYYQQSGAFGYRDQLQDSQVWLPIDPSKCLEQIMLHAAHQFADGSVYHWWNPITETGLVTKCSDDYLWLPFVTASYLRETGDFDALDREAPFVDDDNKATLIEHCLRSFAHSFGRVGEHGLPHIGDMDWNDGLSALGPEDAESVWLAHFLVMLLDEWSVILEQRGDQARSVDFQNRAAKLRAIINDVAWDGDWYRRATDKHGNWIGSRERDAGQIFLNAQTWAILADVADGERADAAWESVKERLLTDYGPLLLVPAYTEPDPGIGYITRYAPGARENGGVYMHAATWALAAACKRRDVESVGRIWNSVSPPTRSGDGEAYAAEPYVLPGNVDGPLSGTPGRAGWTWYTGSASWLNRVSLEWVLGIRPTWGGLRVDPCPPRALGKVRAVRRWRGRELVIEFDAGAFSPDAQARLTLDGRVLDSCEIRESDLPSSGRVHVMVQWETLTPEVKVPARAVEIGQAERRPK